MRSVGSRLQLPLSQDNDGSTPLHLAALHGHALICEVLIRETEAQVVSSVDSSGNSPLHCAALGKSTDAVEAILLRGGISTQTNSKYER